MGAKKASREAMIAPYMAKAHRIKQTTEKRGKDTELRPFSA
jgi:hypothetical protein